MVAEGTLEDAVSREVDRRMASIGAGIEAGIEAGLLPFIERLEKVLGTNAATTASGAAAATQR